VQAGQAEASLTGIHLYRIQEGLRVELATRVTREGSLVQVVPASEPGSGTELLLETGVAPCSPEIQTATATLRVTERAAKPTELGTLRVAEPSATSLQLAVSSGECSRFAKTVSVELTLQLGEQARPYAALLRHALLVDGSELAPFHPAYPAVSTSPNGSLESNLTDRVFTLCDDAAAITQRGLTPGVHRVQWLSRLADGTQLKSPEVSVELRCQASTMSDAGVGTSEAGASDAEPLSTDAGAGDAGRAGDDSPPREAGIAANQSVDAGVDAGADAGVDAAVDAAVNVCWEGCGRIPFQVEVDDPDAGGCSLTAGRNDSLAGLLGAAGVAVATLLRRRRRR
jgi:MYXO-CTERM domain-containing protein